MRLKFKVPRIPSFDVIKVKLFGGGRRAKKKRMKILLVIVAAVAAIGIGGFCLVNKDSLTPTETELEKDIFNNIRVPLQFRAKEPYPWLYNDLIEEADEEDADTEEPTELEDN